MSKDTYSHDSQGHRTDVHRPSVINPGDYEFVKVGVNRKDKIKGGPAGTCHHCGKAIVWEVVWKHLPSGNLVTFGETCTEILGMSNDRISHEMVLLKRQAENERQDEMRKMQKQERIDKFMAEQPEVFRFLSQIDPEEETFFFLVDMKRSMENWGSLTDNQIAAVKRTMKAREEFYARKMAETLLPEPPEFREGRRVVIGTITSDKWQHNDYYGTNVHKMLVEEDDGNKVWGTVPGVIDSAVAGELKGTKVEFTATVEKSDNDEHFGFYKRPTNARVMK